MFKKCIFLLLFFATISTSFAQYPIVNSSNILINSRQIGEDLLLFVPDTATQILFNPARASSYDENFIYTTYYSSYNSYGYINADIFTRMGNIIIYDTGYPVTQKTSYSSFPSYSSISPTISIAALLNINNSKWLLSFSNGIDHSDNKYEDNESRIYNYGDETRINTFDFEWQEKVKMLTNTFHITKIEDAYSFGLFAAFNQANNNRTDNSLSERKSNYNTFRYYDYNNNKSTYTNSGDQYQIGASFSLLGEDWDYVGKISYQLSEYEYDGYYKGAWNNIDSVATDTFLNAWNIREQSIFGQGSTFIKSEPDYYRLYNYYKTKAGWFSENDHFFIKADAIYSTDKFDYKSTLIENRFYTNNDTVYSADSTDVADNGALETKNYWINISTGYVMKFKLDNVAVLIALNPNYQYINVEDVFTERGYRRGYSQGDIKNRLGEMNLFSIRIPFYFHYTPDSWIEFYGGIVYNYSYGKRTEKNNTLFDPNVTADNPQIEENEKSSSNNISSFKSNFLGVNLKHRSGLRLQISFSRNVFDFSYWNFSLGYHF